MARPLSPPPLPPSLDALRRPSALPAPGGRRAEGRALPKLPERRRAGRERPPSVAGWGRRPAQAEDGSTLQQIAGEPAAEGALDGVEPAPGPGPLQRRRRGLTAMVGSMALMGKIKARFGEGSGAATALQPQSPYGEPLLQL